MKGLKSYVFTLFTLIFTVNLGFSCTIDSVTIVQASCLNVNDGSITIHASGAPGMTYSIDGGTSFVAGNSFVGLAAGTYIIVVNSPLPCSTTDTVNIAAASVLSASFDANPLTVSIGETVTFTNTSIGETTFDLFFGDGSDTSNVSVVAHVYSNSGIQNAMLISSNATCSDTAFLSINVVGTSSLVIPNVFSPNGDDINDLFIPTALGIEVMEVKIYNRYGEIVHSWLGPKGYWDGFTFPSGVACSEGAYFYWIKATGYDGVEYEENGIVTLIR